jgi:hypothetical protein
MDSTLYFPGPLACEGPLGAYTLPKRVITAVVSETTAVTGTKRLQRSIVVTGPTVIPDPDPRFSFCLNYLGSPFAEDAVVVSRTEDGLLMRVYSRLADKTKQIAGKVLDIVGVGLTGNPAFDGALRSRKLQIGTDVAIIASLTFDPFDRVEAARMNRRLSELGFCVYIEGATFDLDIPPDTYCAAPGRFLMTPPPPRGPVVKAPVLLMVNEPVPPQAAASGILYRPNLRYELTVKRRREPDLPGDWRVIETRQIEMPNASPVLSLQIERSLFVTRKTDVTFDYGTLLDVTIDKPSELAEFVDIPLQAVQAAFAIPAQMVQVRINRANNEERLIRAQSALIATVRNYKLDIQPGPLQSDVVPVNSNAVSPNRNANAVGGGGQSSRFADPRFRDDAEAVCGKHCAESSNQSKLANPPTCATTCLSRAQQCLDTGAEATADECFNRGIRETLR